LGAVSLLAQRGTGLLVGLLVTPAVVSALSGQQYGQWLMLLQFMGYVSLIDLGNSTVLKLDLATQQHLDNDEAKRRQVGAAMLGLALTTPIYLLAGGLLIWAAQSWVIDAPPPSLLPAALLVLLSLLVGRFSSTLTHVLFGANLDYKATGARTTIAAATAFLDLVIVKMGGGLVGLAANKLLAAILLWAVLHLAVRRQVPWFGCRRPPRAEFWQLFRRNLRYMTAQWGSVFSEATDVVLIGFLLGPAAAAAYSLTGALIRMFSTTASAMLGSVRSGQGDLFGRGRTDVLASLRLQMHTTTILLFAIVGSVILLVNRSFVGLWVGSEHFAGWPVTLGITLLWLLLTLNRQEIGLLMACLEVNRTAWIHLSSALVSFGAGALLGHQFGLAAAVLGLVFGQAIAFTRYLRLSAQLLQQPAGRQARALARPALVLAALFAAGIWSGLRLHLDSWFLLAGTAAVVAAVAAGLSWGVAVTQSLKSTLRQRLVTLATTFLIRPGPCKS
jgi:O-antigen/teichoic acid export membrane protein